MKRRWTEFGSRPTNWKHLLISCSILTVPLHAMWSIFALLGAPLYVALLIWFGFLYAWTFWFLPFHRGSVEDLLCTWFDYQDIEKDGELYLRRWFIVTTRWGCVYLHKVAKSDDDADPHDHPWDFATFILRNGCMERQYERVDGVWKWIDTVVWKSFRLYRRPAEAVHRVRLFADCAPAWTLVFRGRYRRHWNFVRPTGPVFWRTYLNFWGEDTLDPLTPGDIRGLDEGSHAPRR